MGCIQIIDKPKHVINNSVLCIDLIFCTNQSIISKYGVDASFFDKYHHNIIYGRNEIPLPLLSKCVHWITTKADVQNINKSIKNFN